MNISFLISIILLDHIIFVLANSPMRKNRLSIQHAGTPYQTILAKWFHIRKNSSREERERGNYFITVSLSLKLKLSRWEGAAALYFGRAWNSQNQQEQPTTEPKSLWIRLKIAISLPYNRGWNCHNQRRASHIWAKRIAF